MKRLALVSRILSLVVMVSAAIVIVVQGILHYKYPMANYPFGEGSQFANANLFLLFGTVILMFANIGLLLWQGIGAATKKQREKRTFLLGAGALLLLTVAYVVVDRTLASCACGGV